MAGSEFALQTGCVIDCASGRADSDRACKAATVTGTLLSGVKVLPRKSMRGVPLGREVLTMDGRRTGTAARRDSADASIRPDRRHSHPAGSHPESIMIGASRLRKATAFNNLSRLG